MPDTIFDVFSGPLRECWVNVYDPQGKCWAGQTYSSPREAFNGELHRRRPFARVHVIPKTNPKAQEVFS